MPAATATPRFCAHCGAKLLQGARFCSQCGTAIGTAARPAADTPASATPATWQVTTPGLGVLGFVLVAGLSMWAAILSPEPPRAALGGGGGAPRGPQASAQGGAAPSAKPVELPAEVKTFITDLADRAKNSPDDLPTWVRLGTVYYRAAQLDPAYYPEALRAFDHVLAREAGNVDAIRGKANVFYDRNDHAQAIPLYEKVLAATPDDANSKTDLATMYLAAGDAKKAIDTYEAVIAKHPDFLQAHYNLGVTHAQLGHAQMALERFRIARGLATDDATRSQIDDMMARVSGTPPPAGAPGGGASAPSTATASGGSPPPAEGDGAERTPFQQAVEKAFRGAPIMGERIVRFQWNGPGTGRVLVQSFPMDSMPPEVRDKFAARLAESLRTAAQAEKPEGPVRIEIADAAAGTVMSTVTP